MDIDLRKLDFEKVFLGFSEYFFMISGSKYWWINKLRDNSKDNLADLKIELLIKSISKSYGCGTAMPTA